MSMTVFIVAGGDRSEHDGVYCGVAGTAVSMTVFIVGRWGLQ